MDRGAGLLGASSPALAQEACAPFRRIVAAAGETPPFTSLQRAIDGGETAVPGFPGKACRVAPDLEDWPDLSACVGATLVSEPPDPAPGRVRRDRERVYTLAGLRIAHGDYCTGCASVPWSAFRVSYEGARRR